ncbi:MAG TPA: hypothetical protein VEX43_01975 [Chthoniobacterales bacterium]|nr:hypothetical protein [Chthoniobacterales bacterium]
MPGSPISDFDWWSDATPDPALFRYYPDNPNWLGAFVLSQGNGANRDVLFRTLRGVLGGTDYLFLQWVARTSALHASNIDRVNVLLGTGGNYVAFNARLATASSTAAKPPGTSDDGIFTYRVHSCSVSGGVISIDNPGNQSSADIETTGRMWVDVTSPTRLIQTKWGFQVAIPLGTNWGGVDPNDPMNNSNPIAVNLPVSGAFKLWFEVWTSTPMGGAIGPFQWPTTAPQTANVLQIIPPGITESQLLDFSTSGVGCTDAVRLTASDIGTRAVPGGAARPNDYTIKLDLGKPYPPNSKPYPVGQAPDVVNAEHRNEFFCKPTFPVALTSTEKEMVRATFSLASWGSQLSDPTASSWRPIPGGTDTHYDDGNGDCRFIWPDAANPADTFLATLVDNIRTFLNNDPGAKPPNAQNPHQCMLVELSSVDPTVVITTSSVYRNMNIANASTFRRLAEISVVGAEPISSQPRDVYLYVQKFNMPNIVKPGHQGPTANPFGTDGFNTLSAGTGPMSNEVEEIAAFVPTYTVHAYMDTGKTLELEGGVKVPILRPQTAFGYFAQHSGPLYGWETRLYGAEKLAEDFYVLRVPNNGSRYVETVIQARESASEKPLEDDAPCGCLCTIWRAIRKLLGMG